MLSSTYRSNHRRCCVRKGVVRNFAKFSGKFLCQIIFLIKLQVSGLRPATLLKKRLWHRCFPVNFVKNFINTFFTEHILATASAHAMNLLLFLILERVNLIIVLICCKNMTIIFSKIISNSFYVQIVSYCIGKKHLKKYFLRQC